MKKAKTLLTALTAAAMLATRAVSFAAWDQLSATSSGTVTFDKPITVATTDMGAMTPSRPPSASSRRRPAPSPSRLRSPRIKRSS